MIVEPQHQQHEQGQGRISGVIAHHRDQQSGDRRAPGRTQPRKALHQQDMATQAGSGQYLVGKEFRYRHGKQLAQRLRRACAPQDDAPAHRDRAIGGQLACKSDEQPERLSLPRKLDEVLQISEMADQQANGGEGEHQNQPARDPVTAETALALPVHGPDRSIRCFRFTHIPLDPRPLIDRIYVNPPNGPPEPAPAR